VEPGKLKLGCRDGSDASGAECFKRLPIFEKDSNLSGQPNARSKKLSNRMSSLDRRNGLIFMESGRRSIKADSGTH
jgi:hypothetical protein